VNSTLPRNGLNHRMAVLATAAMLVLGACGGAAAGATGSVESDGTTSVGADGLYVFDSSSVHTIEVEFDQDDYAELVQTYIDTSEKDWIEATVTIDGATYERAGIRLKGNSSLRGPAGDQSGTSTLADAAPEDLPWLIRLDKYVDGQNHQGIADLVVRSNNTETSLNEAVALELLDAAGLASQEAVAVGFSVNGSDAVLRLVIENPDDVWMAANFDDDGALYKAESTGDYSYRGDDPELYDEVFDQEAGDDNADLSPLIEFLDFINNSADDVFAAELTDWLDVEQFATYLAMQDLIDNFDDIDGPGNNSYLYYDVATGVFTVVPWDHNLAFGVVNGGGVGGFGGEGFPTPAAAGDLQAPGGALGGPAPDTAPGVGGDAAAPDLGNGGELQDPSGGIALQDLGAADGALPTRPTRGAGGPGGGSNVLVERFLAVPEFADLYEQAKIDLQAELYDSGVAASILDEWVDLLETHATGLVDQQTIESESAAIAAYFE
jgi:spore coat protein CotH